MGKNVKICVKKSLKQLISGFFLYYLKKRKPGVFYFFIPFIFKTTTIPRFSNSLIKLYFFQSFSSNFISSLYILFFLKKIFSFF